MTLFNYWHYIVLSLIFLMLVGGIIAALKQTNKKLAYSMIFSITLVAVFMAVFSVIIVDKYTKKVQLSKLHNKRLLSTEEISYYGIVKNIGKLPIGKVTFEIKLVNKGHATGNVKGGNFYKASGFMNFFSGGFGMLSHKPQTITKKFVVARNLKPGQAKDFRVYFRYPPYFRSTAEFSKVYGH
ncbi:DUF2393 family protein [Sulfurimonas autotrophica]|uniref:DUF2393 domain-containing protein n=1 Tax=Sulfurimonas autotrophica (strain ATCC BAA-671 / DSM 16294 / JCM 11897 / OK10) TaxID=563040 RepID=E0UQN0_SULAO|nr:DUF2393 family protein [Sulfurimonas autotrophica]ADN09902.1 conserved hypothetical protein [Sulfurimonas autotrophica DSM 16294]